MNDTAISQYYYAQDFWNFVKGKDFLEEKILPGHIHNTGAYQLPTATAEKYEKAIEREGIFRSIGSVFSDYKSNSEIITVDNESHYQFVPEYSRINITDLKDDFARISVGNHKLATLFRISSEFVQDAAFDFESYLIKRLSQGYANAEDNAFINGTGNDEPTGILHETKGAETGVSTADLSYDDVISLYFSVAAKYRKNAVWLMNDNTAMVLRKLKDDAGNYLWNNADGTIFGKPVVISEHMPDIGAGAKPIAFGDFSYYWIVKRSPVSVKTLTELFATHGLLGYLSFEFIDGKLIRRDAVKVLSISPVAEPDQA